MLRLRQPFTGDSAGFGPELLARCFALSDEFGAAGGALDATTVDASIGSRGRTGGS